MKIRAIAFDTETYQKQPIQQIEFWDLICLLYSMVALAVPGYGLLIGLRKIFLHTF